MLICDVICDDVSKEGTTRTMQKQHGRFDFCGESLQRFVGCMDDEGEKKNIRRP
jgi:hypothetical protein